MLSLRNCVVIVLFLVLGACGSSSGGGGQQPTPPQIPQPSQLEQLISALRGMTFQEAINSAELPQFVDLIVQNGEAFVVTEGYLTDATDAIRLGAVRAFSDIEAQSVLSSSVSADLEARLNAESNFTILEETQTLVLGIYSKVIEALSFVDAIGDPTFAKLVNLLIAIGEDRIVNQGAWLAKSNDGLLQAGVSALSSIEQAAGISDPNTISELELVRPALQNQTILQEIVGILTNYYPRTLFVELGDLPTRLSGGIQSRFSNGLYIENNEGSAFWSGHAVIASMYADGDLQPAVSYLDFFLSLFNQTTEFNGFSMQYDVQGAPIVPIGTGGQTLASVTVCFVAVHYTVITDDETYLPMVFGNVDWLESKVLNTNLNLLAQQIVNFFPGAPSDNILNTGQNFGARMLFDQLGQLLVDRNINPQRQVQLQSLADTIDQGLTEHAWIDNRFVLAGQATNNATVYSPFRYSATNEPVYDSINHLLSILHSQVRAIPGGVGPNAFLTDAESLFSIDLDIEGFTRYETSSPIQFARVPQLDRTALLALASWSLGDYAKWKFYALQLSSQAVDIGNGNSLLPYATRPFTGVFQDFWAGPETPAVSPTAFFQLITNRVQPFMIPAQE